VLPNPAPTSAAPASVPQTTTTAVDYYNKGKESANGGHWTEAMEAFKQAIRVNPADAGAHFQFGNANQQLTHYTEAMSEYMQAI
jgi:tetratricopeptide (TPR) repeat protein